MNTNLIATLSFVLSTNFLSTTIPAPPGKQICVGIVETNHLVVVWIPTGTPVHVDSGIATAGFYDIRRFPLRTEYGLLPNFFTNNLVTWDSNNPRTWTIPAPYNWSTLELPSRMWSFTNGILKSGP